MLKLDSTTKAQLFTKVEQYTEIPMMILVLVMFVTLITPMVIELDDQTFQLFELIDWLIWGAFAAELFTKTYLSEHRLNYLKKNWLDVVVVFLPILRIFRIFRVARLARGARLARSTRALRILRFARILAFFGKFTTELKIILSRHGFHYLLIVFVGLLGIGTALIFHFDQNTVGASNLPDSLWLTVVAAFSGGFANVYPYSPEAKGISILIIAVGTVLVSFFTASLASYFTEKGQDIEQERIEKKLDQVIADLNQMKQKNK